MLVGVVGEPVRVSEVFEAERSWLFGLAYRLLGSASDAEDVLQSAFERWIVADGTVVSPRMWLTTVVTNLCLKELASARRRRERYTGTWLPEPVVTSGGALGPLETAEQRDSVSFAMLVLLERLSPPERAVFVLREAFGYSYGKIARVLGRSEAGCRQLHRRAGQRLGSPPRVRPDRGQWRRLTEQFLAAAADGDVAGLEQLFAEDAGYVGDGEGSGLPVARKPVAGRSRLARFFAWVVPRYAADPRFTDVRLTVAEVNSQPAVLAWSRGSLLAVVILDADQGMIAALWLLAAPGKLAVAARQAVSLPVEESLPWAGVPGHG